MMSRIDNSAFPPASQARIERARQKANRIVEKGRADADGVASAWLNSRIERDRENLAIAYSQARPIEIASQTLAWDDYFGTMAFEHFLITPTAAEFNAVLDRLAADAKAEFPGEPELLSGRTLLWAARAAGRATLQSATFERCPPTFWRERAGEFGRLDGADLWAEVTDNGWWTICGGPNHPASRQALYDELGRLVRRAVAALGVTDRSIAEAVWMDAVHRGSVHYRPYGINNLCLAYTDYCSGLADRSSVASPQRTSGISDVAPKVPSQVDSVFRRQGGFWTITFDGKTIITQDSKGLNYIAHLLRTAGTMCLAADLVAGTAGATEVIPIGTAGLKLDSTAIENFRSRAEYLQRELAQAERDNDSGRKELIQDELEQLTDRLLEAKGMGGRDRESQDDREKFRKSVSMAIGRSIDAIRKQHPGLADHLTRYIDRGHFLIYSGDIDWQF